MDGENDEQDTKLYNSVYGTHVADGSMSPGFPAPACAWTRRASESTSRVSSAEMFLGRGSDAADGER